jgi:hypothetical protein
MVALTGLVLVHGFKFCLKEGSMTSHSRTIGMLIVLALSGGIGACDSPSGIDNSPLTVEEIEAVTPPTINGFADAYARVLQAHPHIAEDSHAFGRLLLREIESLSSQSVQSFVAVPPMATSLLDRMNGAEFRLLMRPFNWRYGRPTADAAQKASVRARADFTGDQEDDQADAFRHAYWNALVAKCCGVDFAADFATAHEANTQPGDALTMDLNNNAIGRTVHFTNPGLSDDEYAEKIKDYPLSCVDENVTMNTARLVYIEKCPVIEVFDDGPDFDDTYEVRLGTGVLGTTPNGSGTPFTTSDILSGQRTLSVRCTVDGTRGGCGFKVRLKEGIQFTNGTTLTPQQLLQQGGSLSLTIVYPTLRGPQQQQMRGAALPQVFVLPRNRRL